MVFSSTAEQVVLGYDSDTDQTFLSAELRVDSGGSKTTGLCLDDHLGISTESQGFDTTRGRTASAQGKTLRSYLVPDSLTLKHNSILYGKVRDEYGGWETCIYLDLFFNNASGALSSEEWTSSLLSSVALITKGDVMTFYLLTPSGKLAQSQLSIADDLEYSDGRLQARSPGNDARFEFKDPRGYFAYLEVKVLDDNGFVFKEVSFSDQLSNDTGTLSLSNPDQQFGTQYPMSFHNNLRKSLPSLGFTLADPASFSDEATRTTAQCIYVSALVAGWFVGELFFGRVGAAYAPAFATMAGSVVKTAGGTFASDPNLRDEIAAIALMRVLKAELPLATGIDVQEILTAFGDSELSGVYDSQCRDELKTCLEDEFTKQGVDLALLEDIIQSMERVVGADLGLFDISEDELKHRFGDYNHDGVDLLPPPPPPETESPPPGSPPSSPPPGKKGGDGQDYISRWVQDVIALQDQLYLLEPDVGGTVDQSTAEALQQMIYGFNNLESLLEWWPNYTGDTPGNNLRQAKIDTAAEYFRNAKEMVENGDEESSDNTPVLDKVIALEETLNNLKAKFSDETTAEQAELDEMKRELQPAVEKMFADLKLYQNAQGRLRIKIKEINDTERKHGPDSSIEGGEQWFKDLLRRRTSALQETQSIADAAAETYVESEQIVVKLQAHQAEVNDIHKRRFLVDREIAKAEVLIVDLKLMIDGLKALEDRIPSVVDLLLPTTDEIWNIGAPPYHRPDREVEDRLCTAVLKAFQESLIDPSFVEIARAAVTRVQAWFDDGMPATTQQQIDGIVNNPLYKASSNGGGN